MASQEIAANAGVALAGIQVQREGVASSQNIEAIRAMRDINLGAQQFAMTDKALRTELNLAEIASRQNMSAVSAGLTSDLMHVITGHKEAMRGLELQKAALDSNERLGYQAFDNERYVTSVQADLTKTDIAANAQLENRRTDLGFYNSETQRGSIMREIEGMIQKNILDFEAYKFGLPFNERMHLQEQETVRNLAWRQKQIAKQGGMFNLFGGVIDGVFGLASAAMGR